MTEFDLALEFLQTYVRTATSAAEEGVPLHDRSEFLEFCDDRGIEATAERTELVWDLADVINECLRRGEDERDEEAEHPNGRLIPTTCLADGLERRGWRLAFLTKDVGD